MFTVHYAKNRGKGTYDWLDTHYSFSFSNYYDSNNMRFGALRVLNDDIIAPNKGFLTHPHENMEIITIITKGELLHKDSTGATAVLKKGDAQVMSAGTGITHSEHNNSLTNTLELFQIWIIPEKNNVTPRHEELTYTQELDVPTIIASKEGEGVRIYQDAKVSILTITTTYTHKPKHNSYIMIIEGKAQVQGNMLSRRDAIAITQEKNIIITPEEQTTLLLIDVH